MPLKTLCSATALMLALASTASAQDAADEDVIIVTATYLAADEANALRSPTPILDVPQSLSIVTKDQIDQKGYRSIGDIINYTPGVNNSQGEGHRDSVVFRGVRSTADFFIDGVRDDVQYYRPLYNLEQVEILRGPNALLFGRGGTGGILNRVTKKGQLGEQFVGYRAGVDTFGGYNVELDGNYAVGDKAAIRLNGMYESLENHRDFFDGERIGFNPTARLKLTPDTIVDLSYEYADHQRFIDRGIPTGADGRPVEDFAEITFGDPEINNTELTAHLFRAAVQHQFSDTLKANVSAFYGDYDKLYENFYASEYDQIATPDVVTLDGYIDTTQRQNLILTGNLVNEFSALGFGHTIIIGGEYIDTSSDQDRFNAVWDQTDDDNEIFTIARPLALTGGVGVNASGEVTTNDFTADINDDTRADIEVFSAWAQDEIALSEHFDIILGLRYDSFDIGVDNIVAGDTRTRKDEEISPRLGLIFKPVEQVSVYGSYSESFQPRSGEQFANINGDNDRLDPNTFENTEVGVKWDFARGLSFTGSVFQIAQKSPTVADDGETFDIIETEIDGVELQLTGQINEDWYISAGYSYLNGNQAGSDLRPRELPEDTFSLWNSYQVTDAFGIGIGFTHQGESFVNNSNSAVLPSYTRFDAAAYYDVSDAVRLQVNVENLTDALYFPNSHSTHQVTVGAPINARFTVSGQF